MIKNLLTLFAFSITLPCGLARAQSSISGAIVMGTVQSSTGAAIANARITLINLTGDAKVLRASRPSIVFAHADGTFMATGLEAGSYQLCVSSSRDATVLDPCLWAKAQNVIRLHAGEILERVKVVVPASTTLEIHLDDSNGLLDKYEGKGAGAHILLTSISAAGIHSPSSPVNVNRGSRDHKLLLPADLDTDIFIYSGLFDLSGPDGPIVRNTVFRKRVNVKGGEVVKPINLAVTGFDLAHYVPTSTGVRIAP